MKNEKQKEKRKGPKNINGRSKKKRYHKHRRVLGGGRLHVTSRGHLMDWAQTALSYGGGEAAEMPTVDVCSIAQHYGDRAASWFWTPQGHLLGQLHPPAAPPHLVPAAPQPQNHAWHLPAESNFHDAWYPAGDGRDDPIASFSTVSGFSWSRPPQAELPHGYGDVHADTDRALRNAIGRGYAADRGSLPRPATQMPTRSFGCGTPAGSGSSLSSPSSENPTSPDASEWSSSDAPPKPMMRVGAASGSAPTKPTRSYACSISPSVSLSMTTTSTTPTMPSSSQDSSCSPQQAQIIPADAWLSAFHDAKRRLAAYEQHGWLFTPLHPIVLSEEGLRALLRGVDDDGGVIMRSSTSTRLPPSVKRDIFLLHANTAMAYGKVRVLLFSRMQAYR